MQSNSFFSTQQVDPTVYFICKQKRTKECEYHSHDFSQISIILSGTGRYIIEDKLYDVQEGDILFFDENVRHHNVVIDGQEPMVEFFAGISDFQFHGMNPNSIAFSNNEKIYHMDPLLKHEVIRICYEMIAEEKASQSGADWMIKTYMIQILIKIVRSLMKEDKQKDVEHIETYTKSYVVKRIINYFSENYEQSISLEQIAHNMYLSPVYISKIFKEETGESPINYLIKIRLERAKEYLQMSNNQSIKWVAKQVGYDDVYHFSKLFKKYYGISPLYYKKEIKEKKNA